MQQADKVINYHIPITKIIHLLVLQQGIVLVIHHNYQYTVLILGSPQCEILSQGKLPSLSHSFARYARNKIVYVNGNVLEVFDWVMKEMQVVSSLTFMEIYENCFHFFMTDGYIAFWKQSSLKQQEIFTYEVEIYVKFSLRLVKKYKFQKPTRHHISLIEVKQEPHLAVFQTQGYSITVQFPDFNVGHEIKSIYKLLLIKVKTDQLKLRIQFTHCELSPDSIMVYEADINGVRKYYEALEDKGLLKFNQHYEVLVPDYILNYGKKQLPIEARIRYKRKFKMLLLLKQTMKGCDDSCLSEELMKQFINLVE